ncbi:MAG: DUF1365 domain-containing protein [Pseudomonadota bacterium]
MPPIPPEQGAIYAGHVMHMRLRPRAHRFRYRVFTLLLDVDRLADTASRLRLFACNARGLFSHNDRDHGPRDGSPLRPWVEARLAEAGRPRPARIRLLAMPRMLGWVFNPLSVYYCHDAEDRLESVIYEVKNTFGDQIPYVLAAEGDAASPRRHVRTKEMFVSPFIGMDQTYRFHLAPPGERLSLRIKQGDADGDLLIAAQNGVRLPLTDATLARLALSVPLLPFKVIAAIHWQALRLWLKGAPFRRYPGPKAPAGFAKPHGAH